MGEAELRSELVRLRSDIDRACRTIQALAAALEPSLRVFEEGMVGTVRDRLCAETGCLMELRARERELVGA